MFGRFLALFALTLAIAAPVELVAKDKFVVVIDAGHGGGDVGTPHRKGKQDEKTVALNVALQLGNLIESNYDDVKVVYTRKTDTYPTLPERTQIARKAQGNLFISIHVNAAENSSARGFETYVFGITGLAGKSASEQKRIKQRTMLERENLDINGKQIDFETAVDMQTKILCQMQREKHNKYSQELADMVQEIMIGDLKRSSYKQNVVDRGVKAKNIFVLCYSPMPSILVEMGYMSNAQEEKFLNTQEAQSLFANSLYKAFVQYKRNWNKRQLDQEDPTDQTSPTAPPQPSPEGREQDQTQPQAPSQPSPEGREQDPPQPQAPPQPSLKGREENLNDSIQPVVSEPSPLPSGEGQGGALGSVGALESVGPSFRIQFLTSKTLLKQGDPALKGLWPVQYYQVGDTYKYTYGNAPTRAELQKEILRVRESFKDAFIIQVDAQGNRIK